ncbi:MAG: ferrochelatase [Opitutaceae bacterium]|nr:ferrochelatase [Opitutaceae bacterium]
MPSRAVLLVNLGSPDSTSVSDVRRYLAEFLGDERVIDRPSQPWRALILHGIILRSRPKKSAHAYEQIWQPGGSPLIITSNKVRDDLASALEPDVPVYLAMRYGQPSIASVVGKMARDGITELLLFPQYPHYAMSSWETVVVRVYHELASQAPRIRVQCVQPFFADADYIEALHEVSAPYFAKPHDHVLFSFHGIPERHLGKADSSKAHCLAKSDCCSTCSPAHATCYRAQCLATTRALAARSGLHADRHSVSYQSRLVGEPWLTPYTDFELKRLATDGKKRLLVITPAFVTDCLETLEEIAQQGRADFLAAGGTHFEHIPCLNDQPSYIRFLKGRVQRWIDGESPGDTHARQTAALGR